MTSVAWGTSTYTYDPIGNIIANSDLGAGQYNYSPWKIHAVTSANGRSYSYDSCGNMISRGTGAATVIDVNVHPAVASAPLASWKAAPAS